MADIAKPSDFSQTSSADCDFWLDCKTGEKERPWCFLQLHPLRLESLTDFPGLKATVRKHKAAFGGKGVAGASNLLLTWRAAKWIPDPIPPF